MGCKDARFIAVREKWALIVPDKICVIEKRTWNSYWFEGKENCVVQKSALLTDEQEKIFPYENAFRKINRFQVDLTSSHSLGNSIYKSKKSPRRSLSE